ncbi:MAG: hypothetical protein LBD75_00530 [Candidatus Peribacteria bacterium]|jgi:hypothetical protein|nr:hypothetical protein [Candidatus Peribacteria bacterium]
MFSALLFLTNKYSLFVDMNMNKNNILLTYCQGMLSSDATAGQLHITLGEEYDFSSQTSLFVYALCKAWNEE